MKIKPPSVFPTFLAVATDAGANHLIPEGGLTKREWLFTAALQALTHAYAATGEDIDAEALVESAALLADTAMEQLGLLEGDGI